MAETVTKQPKERWYKRFFSRVTNRVDRHPMISFFIVLGVFLALIVASFLIRKPKVAATEEKVPTKTVTIYKIGSAPKVTVQAQTEKSGVVQVVALTNGVVQNIYHTEGDKISRGTWLVGMSSNYQGGNTFSLQRQLAQKQYDTTNDSYDTQKSLIDRQRDLANNTDANNDQLRDITNQSISDTQSLVDLNNNILTTLDQNLTTLEQNATANKDLILTTKQLKSQFLSANNQAKSGLRSSQYAADPSKPPAQISDNAKDIALKQLDIQQKQLDLGREVSKLQLQIAQVNEGLMYPAAPFNGSVQRVFVKVGQNVTPGTPLMVISQTIEDDPINAIAYVPREVAQKISRLEASTLHIGNQTFTTYPSFVSADAVQGNLYAVYFPIPENYSGQITDKGYIQVDLPIGYFDTGSAMPFIPLDSVYQTSDQSYVFVVEKGKAISRQVKLGDVYGSFVEVESGLGNGDQLIVDRNVVANDPVQVNKN